MLDAIKRISRLLCNSKKSGLYLQNLNGRWRLCDSKELEQIQNATSDKGAPIKRYSIPEILSKGLHPQ